MPKFPIDLKDYKPLTFDISKPTLSSEQKKQLIKNIQLVRDTVVFFTAYAKAKDIGGHTGGAYDVVPEYLITEAFARGDKTIYPVIFDEAGHRVAIQYAMSAINKEWGKDGLQKLMHYREFKSGLPGHPETELKTAKFNSGRLGHMWGEVNGIAMANPDKKIVMLGSDGSFLEGNDAEAARIAVSRNLNVKVLFDMNDVTIAGHPTEYMKGFNIEQTLGGHGIKALVGNYNDKEDIDLLYKQIRQVLSEDGPSAVVTKRKMAVGIKGIEGSPKAHDAIGVDVAIEYLKAKGYKDAVELLKNTKPITYKEEHLGSSVEEGKCRSQFGKTVASILSKLSGKQILNSVRIFDPDLEGSTGLQSIREALEKKDKNLAKSVYHNIGPQERAGILAAGGFGSERGKQGIYATFSAFSEMIISELTMLRLSKRNMLIHYSHAGEDGMSDNTCHFGWNIFFLNNGPASEDTTKMYFPADALQMDAIVKKVFNDEGIRFVFSTRPGVPYILDEKGKKLYENYQFKPNKNEIIREGKDGYVISYGEMLYRALDAVEKARKEGIDVGLINKPTLNIPDEAMLKKIGKSKFILLVESQNYNTGLGIRYGTWLLERGLCTKYAHIGATKPGIGGQEEQIPYQGLDSKDILKKIKEMAK